MSSFSPDILTLFSDNAFLIKMQVVDGVDEKLPSLPSTCGVKLTSFSKLLNQVKQILITVDLRHHYSCAPLV